jgi:hypothetical protein
MPFDMRILLQLAVQHIGQLPYLRASSLSPHPARPRPATVTGSWPLGVTLGLAFRGLAEVSVTEFFSWPLGIDSWPLQVPRGRVTVTPPMDGWAGAAHGQKYGR